MLGAEQVDRQVGQKLRKLRKERGMSLAELAETVELEVEFLLECEEGRRRVSASQLWDFCGVFEVSPSYFFDDARG